MPFIEDVNDVRGKFPAKRLSRPMLLGIACLTAIIAILAALGVATSARGDFMVDSSASSSSAAIEEESKETAVRVSSSSASESAKVCVYVVGAVKHPGVYELGCDARVNDAVKAAGGLAEDADQKAVNLARPVVDGEQVTVPSEGESAVAPDGEAVEGSGGETGATSGVAADGRINLNTASQEELESLPGIGEATARKILASREAEGPFASTEDLMRVPGIGEKKYEAMSGLITV